MAKTTNLAAQKLWPYEPLPPWDPDEMFRLLLIHHAAGNSGRPATREETELYTKQLMWLTALDIGRWKFFDVLDKGPGAADTANELVMHLLTHVTPRLKCSVKPIAEAGYKWAIRSFHTSLYRRLLETIEKAKSHKARAHVDDGRNGVEAMDLMPGPSAEPDVEGLAEHLADEALLDRIHVGIPGDIDLIIDLFGAQRSTLLREGNLLPFECLPADLRQRGATAEMWALLTARLHRAVRQYAAECA